LSALPYLEQNALYKQSLDAYATNGFPFTNPPHIGLSTPLKVFACPSDPRVPGPQVSQRTHAFVAFTSYLGVSGLNYSTQDGVLFQDSKIRFAEIMDGTSSTLMLGERPPSSDLQFGWWYAGIGQRTTGSADLILGVNEVNLQPILPGSPCGPGAYPFSPGSFSDPCAMFHYWSPHPGGANFAFADGSVRLIRYSANPIMPALASRAGGEVATFTD
jgi:prepilin-type processing-associated H-X9-DG protein